MKLMERGYLYTFPTLRVCRERFALSRWERSRGMNEMRKGAAARV